MNEEMMGNHWIRDALLPEDGSPEDIYQAVSIWWKTIAGKTGGGRDQITRQERHDMVWLRDAVLPDDGPPDDIYRLAVPILCKMTHEDLADKLGPEYECGVAFGIERGLIRANLKPEWARGLYQLLQGHYLETHTEEDPLDWEEHADQTVRAIPIAIPWGESQQIPGSADI